MGEVETMKVNVENYKGIEFVRISSLPADQKEIIWNSVNTQKIIKILRDNELLNDCLQYGDYQNWYKQHYKPRLQPEKPPYELAKELKLAFK